MNSMSYSITEWIAYKSNACLEKISVVENLSHFLYMDKYKWESKLKESQ